MRRRLADLCRRYWYPVYAYLRRRGTAADPARDLTQGFFCHVLEKQTLKAADRDRGRFRSYLLGALKFYLADQYDRARAVKRGGAATTVSLDLEGAEDRYTLEADRREDPDSLFIRRWAMEVLEQAHARLREHLDRTADPERSRRLAGFLTASETRRYREVAAELEMSESAVKVAVHRLRQRFGAVLREEVARTDVYSLGVLLYELIAGAPPFDLGELRTASYDTVVRKLREEDPPRPSTRVSSLGKDSGDAARARRTDLPALRRALAGDLDWIVMKALEKDPDRRYGSPAELAADVTRHLDDEPVLARPPSVAYRLGKWFRRHFFGSSVRRRPVPALALAAVLAVIAGLLVWGGLGRWRAARQAELAQRLGKEVRDFEWLIRVAQMSPLHAIEDDLAQVRERMDAVARMMEEVGDLARGPGHYALGRGHLALGEEAVAVEHFERSWQAGYRNAESAAGLGLALGETYRAELLKARQMSSAAAAAARVREIETRYRDRALDLLNRRRSESFIPEDYVEALLAFYQGRYEESAAKAAAAAAPSPWLFEAFVLQGDAYFERAIAAWQAGDLPAAGAAAARADRGYARAGEIAESCVEAHLGRCGVAGLLLHMALHGFEWDVDGTWQQAERACADALTVDPGNAEAHRQFSVVLVSWGAFVLRRGGDPTDLYQRAADQAQSAIDLSAGGAETLLELAGIHRMRANWEERTGSDPRPRLAQAEATYRLALDREPRNSTASNNLALVYRDRARYEIGQGLDARASLDRAVASLIESLRQNPHSALPYGTLASQAAARFEEQQHRGVDPCGDLAEVLRALEWLPRQHDIPQQAEAEVRLREQLHSAC